MKAGLVIDAWKLPIFKKYLTEAGFSFEEKGAFTPDSVILHVQTESAEKLKPVVIAAQQECENCKDHNSMHRTTFTHNGGKKK